MDSPQPVQGQSMPQEGEQEWGPGWQPRLTVPVRQFLLRRGQDPQVRTAVPDRKKVPPADHQSLLPHARSQGSAAVAGLAPRLPVAVATVAGLLLDRKSTRLN